MRVFLVAISLLLSTMQSQAQATAFLLDMALISTDGVFKQRVQAAFTQYAVSVIGSESASTAQHSQRFNYATMVLNNPSNYLNSFVWVAASNQSLANDVITAAGANFTPTTSAATIAAAITTATPATTGATDTDIDNAIAFAWNVLSNP